MSSLLLAQMKPNENQNKESHMHARNLNDLSNKIERLIEKEVKTRICAQLSPELDAYYRKLIGGMEKPERVQWNMNERRVRSVDVSFV